MEGTRACDLAIGGQRKAMWRVIRQSSPCIKGHPSVGARPLHKRTPNTAGATPFHTTRGSRFTSTASDRNCTPICASAERSLPSKSIVQPIDVTKCECSSHSMAGHPAHSVPASQRLVGKLRRPMHTSAEGRTIFALSSAPGKAGVAVIRISGPRASQVWGNYDYV